MSNKCIILLLIHAITIWSLPLHAQTPQKTFKQDDVFSIFTKEKNKAKRDSVTSRPAVLYKPYFSITHYIGYNPAYGLLVGVGSIIGIYLGRPETNPYFICRRCGQYYGQRPDNPQSQDKCHHR